MFILFHESASSHLVSSYERETIEAVLQGGIGKILKRGGWTNEEIRHAALLAKSKDETIFHAFVDLVAIRRSFTPSAF